MLLLLSSSWLLLMLLLALSEGERGWEEHIWPIILLLFLFLVSCVLLCALLSKTEGTIIELLILSICSSVEEKGGGEEKETLPMVFFSVFVVSFCCTISLFISFSFSWSAGIVVEVEVEVEVEFPVEKAVVFRVENIPDRLNRREGGGAVYENEKKGKEN